MLEPSDRPFVLRVDASSSEVWEAVVREISTPAGPEALAAEVDCIDAPECIGLNEENIGSVLEDYRHALLFVADALTMSRPGHPLLVVDRREEGAPSLRALPGLVQFVESRVSAGEMT